MPNTVRLHRVLATSPEKVYRAFLEADALAKWLPPNGFACTVHHLEPRVGGTFKMSFRNFTTGKSHAFGGEYVELVPGERLRYTDKFDDPNLPGEMQVRSEEHTSELQSRQYLVCRLLLEKKKKKIQSKVLCRSTGDRLLAKRRRRGSRWLR